MIKTTPRQPESTSMSLFHLLWQQAAVVQDLMFSPSSMTVGEGFIAAGGTSSQVHFQLRLPIHDLICVDGVTAVACIRRPSP